MADSLPYSSQFSIDSTSEWQTHQTRVAISRALFRSEQKYPYLFIHVLTRPVLSSLGSSRQLSISVHHKISRFYLKKTYEIAEKLKQHRKQLPHTWMQAIHDIEKITHAEGLHALFNAPFNLEIGPRTDDVYSSQVGHDFDPNTQEIETFENTRAKKHHYTNVMSPRSTQLAEVPFPFLIYPLTKQQKYLENFGNSLLNVMAKHRIIQKSKGLFEQDLPTPNLHQWRWNLKYNKWIRHTNGEVCDGIHSLRPEPTHA